MSNKRQLKEKEAQMAYRSTSRKIRLLLFAAALLSFAVCLVHAQAPVQLMELDPTGKFLVNPSTGQPVWIQGDSPQAMGVQVSTEDVETYLADRQARGYNVVWIILHD